MKNDRKVLNVRRYKAGYEIRTELVDGSQYGGSDFIIKTAYTHNGDYIGDTKFAYRLCKKWGIAPEKISDEHNVCSIGWCEKDQKWFAWSHRAMCGFGIGSITKKGHCGYTPDNIFELYAELTDDQRDSIVSANADGITIKKKYYTYALANTGEIDAPMEPVSEGYSEYMVETGRGKWTAETLDDAKQMAIDFARSVS